MQANPSIQDSFFGAKIFYFSFTLIISLILLLYQNPLLIAIQNFSLLLPLFFLILLLLSSYLFLTTGQNPGFAQKNSYHHIKDLEEGEEKEQKLEEEEKKEEKELDVENNYINEGKRMSNSEEKNEEKRGRKDNEKRKVRENKEEESGDGEQEICDKCGIAKEIRMKHCNKCERCVHKFDHHCFWVGKF